LLPGKVLRTISRDEWLAQPAEAELAGLNLPVSRVIVTHTATEACDTQVSGLEKDLEKVKQKFSS
jgi:hypothetical protein